MSTQTEHLKLDLREASDIFNPMSTNANFKSLDNIIYDIQTKGGVPTYTTTASANLLKLSRLCVGGLSVKRRDLTAPPSSFVAGDAYIIGGTPTGAWASCMWPWWFRRITGSISTELGTRCRERGSVCVKIRWIQRISSFGPGSRICSIRAWNMMIVRTCSGAWMMEPSMPLP